MGRYAPGHIEAVFHHFVDVLQARLLREHHGALAEHVGEAVEKDAGGGLVVSAWWRNAGMNHTLQNVSTCSFTFVSIAAAPSRAYPDK